MSLEKQFCAVTFQVLYDAGCRVFRLETDKNVDMLRHDLHFLDLDIPLLCKAAEDVFHFANKGFVRKNRLSVLCHPDQVVMEIVYIVSLIFCTANPFKTLHMYHLHL